MIGVRVRGGSVFFFWIFCIWFLLFFALCEIDPLSTFSLWNICSPAFSIFLFSSFHLSINNVSLYMLILPFSFFFPQINEYLPAHIRVVQKSGHPVAWICDPMHGKWVFFFLLSFFLPFFSSFCSCSSSVFSFFLLGSCDFPMNFDLFPSSQRTSIFSFFYFFFSFWVWSPIPRPPIPGSPSLLLVHPTVNPTPPIVSSLNVISGLIPMPVHCFASWRWSLELANMNMGGFGYVGWIGWYCCLSLFSSFFFFFFFLLDLVLDLNANPDLTPPLVRWLFI